MEQKRLRLAAHTVSMLATLICPANTVVQMLVVLAATDAARGSIGAHLPVLLSFIASCLCLCAASPPGWCAVQFEAMNELLV